MFGIIILLGIILIVIFSLLPPDRPEPDFQEEFRMDRGDNLDSFAQDVGSILESLKNQTDKEGKSGGGGAAATSAAKFQLTCEEQGGRTIYIEIRPGVVVGQCFLPAPDAGNPCSNDYQCTTANCDFRDAINSNRCPLIITDKNISAGTYTYIYQCSSTADVMCAAFPREAPETATFTLVGTKIYETGFKNFTQEGMEFTAQ